MTITQDEHGLTDKENEICIAVTTEVIDLLKQRMNLFDNSTSAISMALHVLLNALGNLILTVAIPDKRQKAVDQVCVALNDYIKSAPEEEKAKSE